LILGVCALILWSIHPAQGAEQPVRFTAYPIGKVKKENGRTKVVLDEAYRPGLLGLEGFSHVFVFYWFHRNDTAEKRSILQVYPRGDRRNPLTGVFATRAPVRPNLIALSLCRIISVWRNCIEIDRIDAFPETPVLDLKPYIPSIDAARARLPEWVERKP
jgi:tRNA-Thr(GGU) m(6)t(6)A37 methyltransferase TsaA